MGKLNGTPGAPPDRRVAHRADRRRSGRRSTGVKPSFSRRRVARGTARPAGRPPRRPPATRAPPHWRTAPLHSPARRQGRRPTGASPTAPTAGDQGAAPLACRPPSRAGASPGAPPHRRVAHRADRRRRGRRPTGMPPSFTRRRVARGTAPPARRPPRRPPATRAPPHWRATLFARRRVARGTALCVAATPLASAAAANRRRPRTHPRRDAASAWRPVTPLQEALSTNQRPLRGVRQHRHRRRDHDGRVYPRRGKTSSASTAHVSIAASASTTTRRQGGWPRSTAPMRRCGVATPSRPDLVVRRGHAP